MSIRGTPAASAALLCACILTACGTTEPLQTRFGGDLEVFMDDVPPPGSLYFGTFDGDHQAVVSLDGEDWLELGSPTGIRVPLQEDALTSIHGPLSVPDRSWDFVRLRITSVQVTVLRGSDLGIGQLAEDRTIRMETDEPAVFTSRVGTLLARVDQTVEIRFDLNTERWITPATLERGVVSAEDVAASIGLSFHVR